MATATKGSTTVEYKYNDSGIRTSKRINGIDHIYTLNGSQIVSETWSNNTLIYLYDESGAPIGMQYRQSGMTEGLFYTFFFEKNLFGDVVAIYNEYGVKVISYTYDAWGNVKQTLNNMLAQNLYAQYNPFRYRGYYYDTETSFYYLESRYYDPATGRFINPDSHVNANGDLIGYNMYAYCSNNPVMYTDPTGESVTATIITAAIIGAVLNSGFDFLIQLLENGGDLNKVDYVSVAKSAVSGAVSGALGSYFSLAGMSFANIASSQALKMFYILSGNIIGGAIADVCGEFAVGNINTSDDASRVFISGLIWGSLAEGSSQVAKKINSIAFENASKSSQKAILNDKVFKQGNYHYSWTWNGYKNDILYGKYIDRYGKAIDFAWDSVSIIYDKIRGDK